MSSNSSPTIFRTVVAFTAGCGFASICIAILPVFINTAASTPFLEPLFNTLSYLFSTGVGAILGMLGANVP